MCLQLTVTLVRHRSQRRLMKWVKCLCLCPAPCSCVSYHHESRRIFIGQDNGAVVVRDKVLPNLQCSVSGLFIHLFIYSTKHLILTEVLSGHALLSFFCLVFSWSRLNCLCVFGMRKCYRSSIIAASWMIVFTFTLIRDSLKLK